MLMVISPAKTLDYETPPVTDRATQPEHLDDAQALIEVLRAYSPAQIGELMHLCTLRTSEHRSMYSYVRLSIDRCQLRLCTIDRRADAPLYATYV